MTDDTAPDLAGLCADVAAELEEATSSADEGVTSYARGTAVFARVSVAGLDVRLPVDIAEAALMTPDTAVDPLDRGWVRFTPGNAERHVIDRARAWFEIAYRHAGDS
jgi:hypothetical protein